MEQIRKFYPKEKKIYHLEEREVLSELAYYAVSTADGYEDHYLHYNEAKAIEKLEKLNTQFTMSDYTDKDIERFYDSVNLDILNEEVSQQLGLPLLFTKSDLSPRARNFDFKTNANLLGISPIIDAAWSKFTVDTFGGGINVDTTTGQLYLWATIHFSYQHHGGGRNGAQIGSFMCVDGGPITYTREETSTI